MSQDNEIEHKKPSVLTSIIFVLLSVGVVMVTGAYVWWQSDSDQYGTSLVNQEVADQDQLSQVKSAAVAQFSSETEFKQWLVEAQSESGYGSYGIGGAKMRAMPMMAESMMAMEGDAIGYAVSESALEAERYSETNVQVSGLDALIQSRPGANSGAATVPS